MSWWISKSYLNWWTRPNALNILLRTARYKNTDSTKNYPLAKFSLTEYWRSFLCSFSGYAISGNEMSYLDSIRNKDYCLLEYDAVWFGRKNPRSVELSSIHVRLSAFPCCRPGLDVTISLCPLPASVLLAFVGYTALLARRTKTFTRQR
jgi:hypothetical protein